MSLRMPRIRLSRRLGHIVLGIVGFVLLVFALAAWQVPNFTRKALTGQVAEMLGREVQVGKITFNPFTLSLRVHDLKVAQPGSETPLLAVSEAYASVAWRSVVWFAPVVDHLELHQPKVALVREGPTRFNFSDVQQKVADMAAAQPPAPAEEKDKPLPRFSLNNMLLEGGSISLDDKVTGRKQVVDEITLGVPFISNFGYATDIDVLPRFHARINGSPFDLRGTARPFDKVPGSTLDVVFTGLALDQWADAWPEPLPVKLRHGLLDSDLHIVFEQPHDAPTKLHITGGLGVREFDLRESSDDNLMAWRSLSVRQVELDVIGRTATVGEVELLDPRIQQVTVSMAGVWERILVAAADGSLAADVRPLVRFNVSVIVEQNGRRERGGHGGGGRTDYRYFLEDDRAMGYAREALRQALVNLEAIPAPAGTFPVVMGSGWSGVLLHEAVGHGLEGDFNRKGSSAYSGWGGEKVASSLCTIVDDGTLAGRRGSLSVDDEGTPTNCTTLIENGILKGYMQDKLNARLMGVARTGNGRRESYAHLPMPRMTNTYMLAGESDPEEIIASVKKGIYCANLGGGQVDITSGKFVFSTSEAYLIEDGKITVPVKGATLIGNGPEAMSKVSMVGNDLSLDSGVGTCGKDGQSVPVGVGQPTLKIDAITVGGTGN